MSLARRAARPKAGRARPRQAWTPEADFDGAVLALSLELGDPDGFAMLAAAAALDGPDTPRYGWRMRTPRRLLPERSDPAGAQGRAAL